MDEESTEQKPDEVRVYAVLQESCWFFAIVGCGHLTRNFFFLVFGGCVWRLIDSRSTSGPVGLLYHDE